MTSNGLSNTIPVVQNMQAGMGKCAAMLGLSAGLDGAELELQKMLVDGRREIEKHKANYQTLKMEHSSLQDEFTHVQSELRCMQSVKQSNQEKVQLLFAEKQGELLDKTRELEELRLQVMTPQRLELLRAQVQQELEAPVRERFQMLEQETEKYRAVYNRVRYDYTILKSQFDHQTNEHARILEDTRIRYEAEIGRLEKDREDLVAQYKESDSQRDGKRVETLLREKAQLHLRMKGLEAEVSELQALKENSGQQAESVQRIQNRQLSESQAALKSLEAERLLLRQQLERMESELGLSHEHSSALSGKLHKAEWEVSSLCSQLESLKYSHKMEMTTVKLDCARAKGEMERERDALQRQIDDLQTDVEVVKAALERQKEILVETQSEMAQRLQCAREEELHKSAALLVEKMELEHRLASVEHQRALQVASDNLKEDWDERLRTVQQSEECARKELHNLRCKLQQQSSQAEDFERQKAEFADLQQVLGVHLERLSRSESDLKETNQRLQQVTERMRDELRAAQSQAEKSQDEAERLLEQRQVEWFQEEHKLQQREVDLQQKYSHVKEKLQRAALAQKKVELTAHKRKVLTENKEKKHQNKEELLEARIVELQLEAALYKKQLDEQTKLRRRLKELQQRLTEFHQLLHSEPSSLLKSLAAPLLGLGSDSVPTNNPLDFSALHQRMDNLASAQQQQMEELESLVQKGSGHHS